MNERIYNFSAGPAMLPEPVLKRAAAEMLNCGGSGMSVMEMSHRSKDFEAILDAAEADLRGLMDIPENYHVLFLQGGGCTQFAMVPMNLMRNRAADYIVSGQWSKKAAAEARLFGRVNVVASSEEQNFSCVPSLSNLPVSPDADYVYLCQNETIHGTTIKHLPDTKGKPLVADVSSMFLSEPMDVSKYGLLFAGAQKNAGPAGVTVVIIRDDLIHDDVLSSTPTMMQYKTHADARSLYNTPPCWGIYICGLVFKWLKELGGLAAMRERNEKKAALFYNFLDNSKLFHGTVRKEDRSLMNIPFVTGEAARRERLNPTLDAKFVAEAEAVGLRNLKGHRSVGGMRASLYNAVPYEAVEKLVAFMEKFEKENA